ncbi:MAG: PAS domain S-box protein [Methanotrichaceae archaeon]|jgi:PAS domain S-box-containing protein
MVEPYRILIVEDDLEHADLIRMGFRKHDEFFLDFASTGEQGLEMIRSGSYDLISVDLVLPGIGGLDVLVRIRKFDQDTPVVMVSGHGTTELAVVAFENRATKYVVKSMESFKSLPYIFENLIQEARFKASERAMRMKIERSERIHRSVVENSLGGIYILQDGVFKLVNPKLGEIFGCAAEELVGMPFWHLVQPDDMQCVSRLDRGIEGPAPAYESRVLRKDGDQRWIEFRTVPIEYDGQRAVLGNIVDITERKEMEIELVSSNRELEAVNSIMSRVLQPDSDVEKDITGALADLESGIEGGEVGGIFLLESGNLVLRSLFGPVKKLIRFIEGRDSKILLAGPNVYKMEEFSDYIWTSVPLTFGRSKGTIVVASTSNDGDRCLSFLQKAAPHICHIMNASVMKGSSRQSPSEELLLTEAKGAGLQSG